MAPHTRLEDKRVLTYTSIDDFYQRGHYRPNRANRGKRVIGIDPGQTGAIALAEEGRIIDVFDMPTVPRLHGRGQQVDGQVLSALLRRLIDGQTPVNLEAVSARPNQGVSSMFRFGESVGVVLGVCGALALPVRWVTPVRWKKEAGLLGKPKDAARTLIIQTQPHLNLRFQRKKDIGRADACFIALYRGK